MPIGHLGYLLLATWSVFLAIPAALWLAGAIEDRRAKASQRAAVTNSNAPVSDSHDSMGGARL